MNEEEKKAINRIYDVTHNSDGSLVNYIDIDDVANTKEDLDSCEGFCEAIETVLNLIGKQSSVLNKIKQLTKVIICDEEGKLQRMIYADELYETFRELEVK